MKKISCSDAYAVFKVWEDILTAKDNGSLTFPVDYPIGIDDDDPNNTSLLLGRAENAWGLAFAMEGIPKTVRDEIVRRHEKVEQVEGAEVGQTRVQNVVDHGLTGRFIKR